MSLPFCSSIVPRKVLLLTACLALAGLAGAQAQRPSLRSARPPRVFHVPADSRTLQGAIERALDGDVVLVAPGTYRERIDFLGKAIEVIGVEGPARTILRSPDSGTVVLFRNGEGPDSRLMGFTITGGFGDFDGLGGGVSCTAYGPVASPYLSDCIIEHNGTDFLSGGLGAAGVHGDATLERCILRQNNAFEFAGGAVEGAVTMLQCVVEDNWSCDGGGGLRLHPGSLVQDCVIQRNGVGPCGYHGLLYPGLGGAIQALDGPVELVGCVLRDNYVDEFADTGDPSSCAGYSMGGAIGASDGVTLRRCTIAANRADNCSLVGGIQGEPALIDSIVSGNDDTAGFYTARSSFRFSLVQGGASGQGSFDGDPLFVDSGIGDLRLREGSPCVDAGDPSSPLDPDGTRADLGAFHRPVERAPLGVAWHETSLLHHPSPAPFASFGRTVSIDGNTALVGAAGAADDNGLAEGSVHVFLRAGSTWSDGGALAHSEAESGDDFGAALTVEGDIAVVGAPLQDRLGEQAGAAYVYERSTSDGPFIETVRLVPSEPQALGLFGIGVALDSGTLVVGALGNDAFNRPGSAFVFQRQARGKWREVANFTAPPVRGSGNLPFFGASIAISGTTIVVGARLFESGDGGIPGRAFVYERAGATPSSWVQTAVLVPTDTRGLGSFGSSVAIAGDAILIGSNFGVYTYERGGPGLPWSRATRIEPFEPTRVVAQTGHAWLAGAGSIRELVQTSPGATWSEVARVNAPSGPIAADRGTLLAGAPTEDTSAGAVHVFTRGVQLDSIGVDQAADEEEVVLHGLELDTVTQVLVGGVEQPVVRQSASELVLRPARRDPGFADLELRSSQGALVLPGAFESLPTLRVIQGDRGATSEVRLANGASGAFVLLASLDLRATPLTLASPPTWYGLWLDLVPGRSGKLLVDAFDSSGVANARFSVPNTPALAGLPIHVQAWCRRGLFGPGRYSFTNLVNTSL